MKDINPYEELRELLGQNLMNQDVYKLNNCDVYTPISAHLSNGRCKVDAQKVRDYLNSHFSISCHLLWDEMFDNPKRDEEVIRYLLQGLPYNPLERILKINIPSLVWEQVKKQIKLKDYKTPIGEVVYTSLGGNLLDGKVELGDLPLHVVPDQESIDLSKKLENRGYKVLSYSLCVEKEKDSCRIAHVNSLLSVMGQNSGIPKGVIKDEYYPEENYRVIYASEGLLA